MKVTIYDRSNDPKRHQSPYEVSHYAKAPGAARATRVREYYGTKAEAEQRAVEIRRQDKLGLSPAEMEKINRLVRGTRYEPAQLIEMALDQLRDRKVTAVSPEATIREGSELVIANAKDTQAAPKTIRGYESMYRIINATMGDCSGVTVAEPKVKHFFTNLRNKKGVLGAAAAATKQHYLIAIRMALIALGIQNPLPKMPNYLKNLRRKVEIFSNDEVRKMFISATDEERPILALAVFGTLRPELLSQLPVECVDAASGTVFIPEDLAKDGNSHPLQQEHVRPDGRVVPGLPPILFEWLRAYPYKPMRWELVRDHLKRAVGRWIHDGLRHTGASNYNAYWGKELTSALLTHEGLNLVYEHYVTGVLRSSADQFYGIHPRDFVKNPKPAPTIHGRPVPTKEELAAVIWVKPATHIAKEYGCSDGYIGKLCKRYGLTKPGPGYWRALRYKQEEDRDEGLDGSQPAAA